MNKIKLGIIPLFALCVLAYAFLLPGGIVRSADAAVKPQTICPIMGGAINKKLFVDVKGKRIYVCCPGCIGEIKANPDAALAKIAENGETAEDAPVKGK